MTDNSYMFVDEDKEDISKAGGSEPKGRYLDETITGDIEDESTINLVADEDVTSRIHMEDIPTKDSVSDESSVSLSSDRIVSTGKGFGIASLLLGAISIALFCSFINFFTSILGIIFGVVQIRRGSGKGFAIVGILCSIFSVILLMVCMSIIMKNTAFVDLITQNMFDLGKLTQM